MIHYKTVFALIFVFCSCKGSFLYWKTIPHEIKTLQKNYIRFRLPRNIVDGKEGIISDKYYVKVFWEEADGPFHRFLLINPDRGSGLWDKWFGEDHFVFYPDCDYRIDIPGGENSFKIEIAKVRSYNGFHTEKEVRLFIPYDHSIFVSLLIEPNLSSADTIARKEVRPLNSRIRIHAEVGPNPNPDADFSCEVAE
ncbi:hypothetical protein EHQ12_00865 [Leptospira gomenensis]|nr:hypothetical protein [Leptospira gomenensis]TGK44980.1 hypothetical protein EHQ12_00865 [Leptospira gomenensis]TGK67309.1 hypothetical protein EHQ13_02330 [Leptospira gomenensis]